MLSQVSFSWSLLQQSQTTCSQDNEPLMRALAKLVAINSPDLVQPDLVHLCQLDATLTWTAHGLMRWSREALASKRQTAAGCLLHAVLGGAFRW